MTTALNGPEMTKPVYAVSWLTFETYLIVGKLVRQGKEQHNPESGQSEQ